MLTRPAKSNLQNGGHPLSKSDFARPPHHDLLRSQPLDWEVKNKISTGQASVKLYRSTSGLAETVNC